MENRCVCNEGYEGNASVACTNINECLNNQSCPVHTNCTDTDGSFLCLCKSGFDLVNDVCTDINECIDYTDCPSNSNCTNTIGSFECVCNTGYIHLADPSLEYCSDIDECLLGYDNCATNTSICTNVIGSFECSCRPGYSGNGITCFDIDECNATNTNDCDIHALCTNTIGSFLCDCVEGFTGSGKVCSSCEAGKYKDLVGPYACTQCLNHSYSPIGSPNSSSCLCVPGYYRDQLGNCSSCPENTYKEEIGNEECTSCPSYMIGPVGSSNSSLCECQPGFTEANSSVSSGCTACESGTYKVAPGPQACTICPAHTVSAAGSATVSECICMPGYTGAGGVCTACESGKYKDVNGSSPCKLCPSKASSNPGSTSSTDCRCDYGSYGDGCPLCPVGTYKDTIGSEACMQCPNNSTSTRGARHVEQCTCNAGFSGVNGGVCFPCASGKYKMYYGSEECDPCIANSFSAPGSISPSDCICNVGYQGSGDSSCTDIDECQAGTDNCDATRAVCINTQGSFECSCVQGFTGNGTSCLPERIVKSFSFLLSLASTFHLNTSSLFSIISFALNVEYPLNVSVTMTSSIGNYSNHSHNETWRVVFSVRVMSIDEFSTYNQTLVIQALLRSGYSLPFNFTDAILVSVCGNGQIEGFEMCDDGNLIDGDGCDSICQREAGWTCRIQQNPSSTDNATTSVCSDINECLHPDVVCSPYARCYNTPGSFLCTCLRGFFGDGKDCTDDFRDNTLLQENTIFSSLPVSVITNATIEMFGAAIALEKNMLLVGSDGQGAFLYERELEGRWDANLRFHFRPSQLVTGFGISCCMYSNDIGDITKPSRSQAVIGSKGNQVHIFERQNQGQWSLAAVLRHDSLFFGSSVATYEDDVLVGAYGDQKAFVFGRDAVAGWSTSPLHVFLPDSNLGLFGSAVAIRKSVAVVASLYSGTVYVFFRDMSGQWLDAPQVLSYSGSDPVASSFGASISMSDRFIFVGDPQRRQVHVYLKDSNTSYSLLHILTSESRNFGSCVANTDLYAVVGAMNMNKAFILKVSTNDTWNFSNAHILGEGQRPAEDLGSACSITNQDVALPSVLFRSVYMHASFCAYGFYGWSTDNCTLCPPNTIAKNLSRTIQDCVCAPGYYGEDGSSCELCPANHFCAGGVEKLTCLNGTSSRPGSSSSSDCVVNRFSTKNISQSSTRANGTNILTMVLEPSIDVFASDHLNITISGLICGGSDCAACPNGFNLTVSSSSGGELNISVESSSGGRLVISHAADMLVRSLYRYTWCIVNPPQGQRSPDIFIEASASSDSGVRFVPSLMLKAAGRSAPLAIDGLSLLHAEQSELSQVR
eukprot:764091-Hanusia_phi.AAC.2